MKLFSADATMFLKKIQIFFDHQKLKKPPSKVAQNSSNPLFFPYCPDCLNGPNRRIHVPKCGLLTNCIQNWGLNLQIKQFDELNTIPEDLCLGILISCKTIDTLWSQIPSKVALEFMNYKSLVTEYAQTYLQSHDGKGFLAMFTFQLENTKR